jgi:hypothetical protein
LIDAFNEASVVLPHEHAEIVIETGPAVHQIVFRLQQVTQSQSGDSHMPPVLQEPTDSIQQRLQKLKYPEVSTRTHGVT